MIISTDYLLDNKTIFEHYARKTKNVLATNTFANIFAWRDFFEFEFKVINDSLCVFAHHVLGTFLYLPPLGEKVTRDTVDKCFGYMHDYNEGKNISRVENIDVYQLKNFYAEHYRPYLKGHEYCYFRNDIAQLEGHDFKSKRSDVNHFIKNNTFEYLPYDASMLNDRLALYDLWAINTRLHNSDDICLTMLDENYSVQQNVIVSAEELNMTGRVVKVDGQIKAYTFGYPLNENTFCIFSEITDLNIKGSASFIFSQFCRDEALASYPFINVMDDSGIVQLQQTKMSFHPTHLWPVYSVQSL